MEGTIFRESMAAISGYRRESRAGRIPPSAKRGKVRTYTMRFEADGRGEPKIVEFDGEDPHAVFRLLEREMRNRRVSLWDGAKSLGSLTLGNDGLWEIARSEVPVA